VVENFIFLLYKEKKEKKYLYIIYKKKEKKKIKKEKDI